MKQQCHLAMIYLSWIVFAGGLIFAGDNQGIFSALHNGMLAGMAVHTTLEGDATALDGYTKRLEEIRRVYLLRCQSMYRSETRWPGSAFWSEFRKDLLTIRTAS